MDRPSWLAAERREGPKLASARPILIALVGSARSAAHSSCTIALVGVLDSAVGFLGRFRASALFAGLEVGVEGQARLCDYDHVPIVVLGGPRSPPIAPHLDVSLQLWNRGHAPVAILEVRGAEAAGQKLGVGNEMRIDDFRALTLEPGRPKVDAYFTLSPADGEALRAQEGDEVKLRLRRGHLGRDRRVTVRIGPR